MPTVLRVDGYEILIYFDDHLPAHVHVFRAGKEVVINLNCSNGNPAIRDVNGMKPREVRTALRIVKKNFDFLCEMWESFHGYI